MPPILSIILLPLDFHFSSLFEQHFFQFLVWDKNWQYQYEINFLFAHVCVRDLKVNDETNLYGLKASCTSGASECVQFLEGQGLRTKGKAKHCRIKKLLRTSYRRATSDRVFPLFLIRENLGGPIGFRRPCAFLHCF